MNIKLKRVLILLFTLLLVINSFPTRVDAHRAYFMQILIDEGQLMYVSNVIKDSELQEANKTEAKLWKYDGNPTTSYDGLEGVGGPDLVFTFPSKAEKHLKFLNAKNNATRRDEARAYEISDTLIPNLNEILLMMNDGEMYTNTDELIKASEEIVNSFNGGTITRTNLSITFPSGSGSKATVTDNGQSFEYLVKMEKGYQSATFEDGTSSKLYNPDFSYPNDSKYLSIADMITQANYTYSVKGHSSADLLEYATPGTIELKLMEFFSSGIASLRSLLGLRDISELVYNDGIVGSGMYYNGLMPTKWFQKSMSFHMIFQALTWIALGIAIIKLALQRNLATISASSRVSLMDGIKDLIISGFMLIAIFLVINLLAGLNKAIIAIFKETAPVYSGFSGEGVEIASFGGVLLQLYYFLITLYLNVIYIARAISLSILIATAPIFVASIAFQTKSKDLFETWGRMLIADIFMQSFHAFLLSFFLSIQMSTTRGIELAVVSFALIPATQMFKQIVTKSNGGLTDKMGMSGMAMAGSVVGAGVGAMAGKGKSGYKGSVDEGGGGGGGGSDVGGNAPSFDSRMKKDGISADTPSKSSTEDALNSMGTNLNTNAEKMSLLNEATGVSSVPPGGDGGGTGGSNINPPPGGGAGERPQNFGKQEFADKKSNQTFKGSGTLENVNGKNLAKKVGRDVKNVAVGGAMLTAGAAAAMAFGGMDGGRAGASMMGAGMGNLSSGIGGLGTTGADLAKKGVNTIQDGSGNRNIFGAEKLNNGNVAIHRDKNLLKQEGLNNATMTDDDNLRLTYDTNKLGTDDLKNVNSIKEKFAEGDSDFLKANGIENVYETQEGNTVVDYNDYGKSQLGYKKAYTTDDSIIEIKDANQSVDSNLTYDINGGGTSTKNPETADGSGEVESPQPRHRDIYDGPSESGESPHRKGDKDYNGLGMDDLL